MAKQGILRVVSLFAFLLFFGASTYAQGDFKTLRYDVRLDVRKDRLLDVTEIITVDFTASRRGIIRWIPTAYPDRLGTLRLVGIHFIGARRLKASAGKLPVWKPDEGSRDQILNTISADRFQVRIGNPSVFHLGTVRYTLRYQVRYALTDFEATKDAQARSEFYWNAVPVGWESPIEESKVRITFPKSAGTPPAFRAFVGTMSSTDGISIQVPGAMAKGDTNLLKGQLTESIAQVEAAKPLPLSNGITVALAIPKGAVNWLGHRGSMVNRSLKQDYNAGFTGNSSIELPRNLYPMDKIRPTYQSIAEEYRSASPVGWLALALPIFVACVMRFLYRLPDPGPLVTRFEPPSDFGAAECGLLVDQRFNVQDFVAGIITLAQKGALRISSAGKVDDRSVAIEMLEWKNAIGLTPLERRIATALDHFGPTISPRSLYGAFGYTYQRIQSFAEGWAEQEGYFRSSGKAPPWPALSLVIGTAMGTVLVTYSESTFLALIAGIFGLGLGILLLLGTSRLTHRGAKARQEIFGLREFIARAKVEEIERIATGEPAQALFERLLPYAVAFGYAGRWTNAFASLAIAPPSWYDPSFGDRSSDLFTALLQEDLFEFERNWASATYVPRQPAYSSWSSSSSDSSFGSGDSIFTNFGGGSSNSGSSGGSFGGGGSSGGGGGGGGGGSW